MLEPTAPFRPSVVVLAASALVLAACGREETFSPPAPTAPAPAPEAPTIVIAPDPTLDRVQLLQAMDAAASAHAAGVERADASLTGRRFVVRQAFGCNPASMTSEGAGEGVDGLAAASWGPERRTVRLTLSPGDWTASPLIAGGAETWEAAEGFWLNRPWLRTDGCPAVAASGVDGPTSAQTVGLAAVFDEDGSRLGRRNGRAYSFTIRGENDQPPVPPAGGFRLVLEGRMAAYADGRAIRCRAAGPDERPVCIGAVQLDRVAFEDAQGAVLSEWR
jgi:hypothetical protein